MPRVYESGVSIKNAPRISGGAKLARNALFMSSPSASRFHSRFNEIYKKLIAKGKPPKKALIAVAHKTIKHIKIKYFYTKT